MDKLQPRLDDNEKKKNSDEENEDIVDNNCVICFESMSNGKNDKCEECKKNFHSICISKWLKNSSKTCPLCRSEWKIHQALIHDPMEKFISVNIKRQRLI